MSKFTVYTQDNAPEASKPILGEVKKTFGFVPNLQANMAESPELLAGYTTLWDLFAKSSLSRHEQQVAFPAAGHTRRNVLEVVLGVATKVMSNYTNHLVDTQLDKFMVGNEWTKPA